MVFTKNIRTNGFSRLCCILVLAVFLTGLSACGDRDIHTSIIISGSINGDAVDTYSDKAVMVAVTKASAFDRPASDPLGGVVKYVAVDRDHPAFSIDLFGTGLAPGDDVYVLAFIDVAYSGGIPSPDVGDIIGFYTDQEALSPALTLKEGINSGVDITINREVFSFDSSISGMVNGDETGDLTIIVYAGEMASSDFTGLDVDCIIGFAKYEKGGAPLSYSIDILPYGYDIPIVGAYIFAFLDVNQNNLMDDGDRIGYFSTREDSLPSSVTIQSGHLEAIDIQFYLDINTQETPQGDGSLSVSGDITLPDFYTPDNGSVFIIVADPNSLETISNDPLDAVRYIKKLSPDARSFTIDLPDSGFSPGEDIMLIGLWDRNNDDLFPDLNSGDYIGFFFNEDTFSVSYTLGPSGPEKVDIHINREVFDFSAGLTGTITADGDGEILLLAYAGEINALDFTALDFNSVVGFKQLSQGSPSTDYSLPIFPYGFNVPIENVYVIAVVDNNGNGKPDAGDAIGFHTDQGTVPDLVTIYEGVQPDVDIDTFVDIPVPSGQDIKISGIIDPPADYFASSTPIFIIVADTEKMDDLFSDPPASISYFAKLSEGETGFELDLSETGLSTESEIVLIALWDRDYEAGFPDISEGDMAGYYQNKTAFRSSIVLSEINSGIPSGDWEFIVNRHVFEHHAEIAFSLEDGGGVTLNTGDRVTLIAVQQDGVDDTWPNLVTPPSYDVTDMDYIVGIETIRVDEENSYSFNLLPAIYEGIDIPEDSFSINDVYILALVDANLNGKPDDGEDVGFYWQQFLLFRIPATVNIADGVNTLDRTVRFPD